jgi:hypothetical protein
MIGPRPDAAPTIVMLHEGSARSAPGARFREASEKTGLGVFLYSRCGLRQSSTVTLQRPLDYMQREAADVLPAARRDRLSPRHPARALGRRLDRGAIRRHPSGSPRARARADGAALLRRGEGLARSATRARRMRRPNCARGSRVIMMMSMLRFAAGTRRGSIRNSARAFDITEALPTSACDFC